MSAAGRRTTRPAVESRVMSSSSDAPPGFHAEPEAVARVILGRRTIHQFRPEVPPLDDVMAALDAARWAPNHHHTEPWRFRLAGPKTIEKIIALNTQVVTRKKGPEAARQKLLRWSTIPGWVIATCRVSEDPQRQEEDYAACCCAVHNLALVLWSRGIGLKWSTGGVTRDPAFAETAGFHPEEERVVGLLWYGYPEKIPAQQRKPLADVLTVLP